MFRVLFFFLLFGIISCGDQAPPTDPPAMTVIQEDTIVAPPICLDSAVFMKSGVSLTQKDSSLWLIQVRRRGIPTDRIRFMDWYFHRSCDPAITTLDSLIVHLQDGQQLIQPFEYTTEEYRAVLRPKINFVDFNFDGFLDFRIYSAPLSSEKNHVFAYYLYDRQRGDFQFSEILSQTTNLQVDAENGTIQTFNTTGHDGMVFRSSTYIFRKDEMVELSRQQQDFLPDLGVYVLEYYQLRNGNFKLIDQDTIKGGGAVLENY